MINTIIFSKNRACQLELLLRSLNLYCESLAATDPVVIYKSDPEYARGYDRLITEYSGSCRFCRQTSDACYKDLVLSFIDPQNPFTIFLVDDDVFLNRIEPSDDGTLGKFMFNREICCYSLRLWPGTSQCYPLGGMPAPCPESYDAVDCTWKWRGAPGDWGYPGSLDGHFFRTNDILPLVSKLQFSSPNTLESQLDASWNVPGELMMGVPMPVLVNNPCNRVQEDFQNRCGTVSTLDLEREFEIGNRLALNPYVGLRPASPHTEVPIVWNE